MYICLNFVFQLSNSSHISYDSILIRLSETANRAEVVTNAIIDDEAARNHTIGQLNPAIGYTVELATSNLKGFSNFSTPYSIPAYSSTGKTNKTQVQVYGSTPA